MLVILIVIVIVLVLEKDPISLPNSGFFERALLNALDYKIDYDYDYDGEDEDEDEDEDKFWNDDTTDNLGA